MERLWSYQIDIRDISHQLKGFTFIVASDAPEIALTRILKNDNLRNYFSNGWKLSNFAGPHSEVYYA